MSDSYNYIVRNCVSNNVFKKFIIERELNKLFLSNDIDNIINVGLMIDNENFHNIYQKRLISLNNSQYIYKYALCVKKANIKLLEDAIIGLNDIEYIYLFARDIKNADINKLQAFIVKSKDIDYLIKFSNDVDCDTKLIEDTIINLKSVDKLFSYALKCKCANIDRIQNIILNFKSEDIVMFAKNIKGININLLEDELIKKCDYRTIYKIAASIKTSNKEKLERVIINSNNAKYIYRFATMVSGANINLLESAIIKTNNLKYLYKFMLDINSCNKDNILKRIFELDEYTIYEKLDILIDIINNVSNINLQMIEDYIISSNSSKCIYTYALNGKVVNIKLLEDKIIELNQLVYICLFALNINGSNILRIEKYIRNNGDREHIKEICEFYEVMIECGMISISNYEDAIINMNYARYLYDIARKYKECDMLKIEDAIIKSNDAEYIYKFAKLKGHDLINEENALISINDLNYLVLFACCEGVNVKRIEEIIINSNNPYAIYTFITKVSNNDVELLESALKNTKNMHYINKMEDYKNTKNTGKVLKMVKNKN